MGSPAKPQGYPCQSLPLGVTSQWPIYCLSQWAIHFLSQWTTHFLSQWATHTFTSQMYMYIFSSLNWTNYITTHKFKQNLKKWTYNIILYKYSCKLTINTNYSTPWYLMQSITWESWDVIPSQYITIPVSFCYDFRNLCSKFHNQQLSCDKL